MPWNICNIFQKKHQPFYLSHSFNIKANKQYTISSHIQVKVKYHKKWKDFHHRKREWSEAEENQKGILEPPLKLPMFHVFIISYRAFKKFTNKYSRSMKCRKAKRDKREVKYNKAHCVLRLFLENISGTRCLSRQKEGSGQWWVGMVRQARQLSFFCLFNLLLFFIFPSKHAYLSFLSWQLTLEWWMVTSDVTRMNKMRRWR